MGKPKAEEQIMGLVEFARKQRLAAAREACRVCHLSEEVRAQLKTASDRGIRRGVQLEWIRTYTGVDIEDAELTAHRNGRHDEAA